MSSLERHDGEGIRCLQLGGPVTFNYCRRANRGLPCKLVVGCWQGRIEALAFLAEHFTAEQLRAALEPAPGGKLERLIGLVERTRAELEAAGGDR
ncbi:MAG TPA: hypothetical protein VM221_04295 [Armatimonadota bacterium]|nr:hypothetical protein [Armatimonadota bacterium]